MRKTYKFVCQLCQADCTSIKPNRMFCSIKCRVAPPTFKSVLETNLAKIKINKTGSKLKGELKRCACGANFYKATASPRRFCSRICYREHMRDRFDQWVKSPGVIEGMHCFDEFMLQEKLPCLVKGCEWEGENLSLHVNIVHGISVRRFKELAGFNLLTGLVGRKLRERLAKRERPTRSIITKRGKGPTKNVVSKEAQEHIDKRLASKE